MIVRRLGMLAGMLAAVALLGAVFAAVASAQTFTVNSLGDEAEAESCGLGPTCTLREAIERSNASTGADTIEFSVPGTIAIEGSPLPSVTEATTIDATTAPGYSGSPVVEIDGSAANNEGPVNGLELNGGPTTVEGLALANFTFDFYSAGIYVGAAQPAHICADYLGTTLSGEAAAPNSVGVLVAESAHGTQVGAGCPPGRGNVISGNEYAGVLDEGLETEIGANLIGESAAGGPLGNGGREIEGGAEGAGVFVEEGARETFVGPSEGGSGNTIAFNVGPGVEIAGGATGIAIGGNSIHSNFGLGIEYQVEPAPPTPSIKSAEGKQADTTVAGSLSGEADKSYFVEFFANQACDEGGAGEGQTPLGGLTVTTDPEGEVTFSAHGLAPLPAGQAVITATATPEAGSTSEFSKCLTATILPPPTEETKPPSGPLPVNGRSVAVAPTVGTILVKLPGEEKFHPLKAGEIIPVGTIVDATHGRVTLTSIDDEGHEQTAIFYGGKFQVFQQPGSTLVVLRLRGDGPGTGACQGAGGASGRASATISRRRGRHLWGSGHGSFRTEGAHGSATVRGTIWFTEDRCDGTFFKTKRGVVTIRDFAKHKTVSLPAGSEYLAAAP